MPRAAGTIYLPIMKFFHFFHSLIFQLLGFCHSVVKTTSCHIHLYSLYHMFHILTCVVYIRYILFLHELNTCCPIYLYQSSFHNFYLYSGMFWTLVWCSTEVVYQHPRSSAFQNDHHGCLPLHYLHCVLFLIPLVGLQKFYALLQKLECAALLYVAFGRHNTVSSHCWHCNNQGKVFGR